MTLPGLTGSRYKHLYNALAERMMMVFSGLMTIQWLVGIALLIALGNYSRRSFWSHAGTMTVATAVSYSLYRWRTSNDSVRYRTSLFVLIAALVLVAVGIALISSGRQRTP